jgi:hypothetical protein
MQSTCPFKGTETMLEIRQYIETYTGVLRALDTAAIEGLADMPGAIGARSTSAATAAALPMPPISRPT